MAVGGAGGANEDGDQHRGESEAAGGCVGHRDVGARPPVGDDHPGEQAPTGQPGGAGTVADRVPRVHRPRPGAGIGVVGDGGEHRRPEEAHTHSDGGCSAEDSYRAGDMGVG